MTSFEEAMEQITDAKELAYVEARIGGMKAQPASRVAGYTSSSSGTMLEKRPHIAAAIKAHFEGLRKELNVSREDITQLLLDAVPMVESATEQVHVAQALSKHMGFEQERTLRIKAEVEKSINISGTINVETMHLLDEQQLLELAGLGDDAPWIEGESERVDE